MGAQDFYDYAFGKTAQDAFHACVDNAQYEHGHGGYSGTIAEKGSFRLLPTPKTRVDLYDLAACAMSCGEEYTYTVWRKLKEGEAPPQWGYRTSYNDDGTKTTLVPERKKVPAKLHDWIRRAARIADDKWGPAAAVEITGKAAQEYRARAGLKGKRGKVFLFFGLASS